MRHAQTHANKDKTHFQSVADYAVLLTEIGEQQAETGAKFLTKFFVDYKLRELAIARSTYQRADQTCNAILENLPRSIKYQFFSDVRLREQDYNPLFDGLPEEERSQRFPKAYEKYSQRTFYVDETGAETGAALVSRCIGFLTQTFLPEFRNADAGLLVTHSKTMRALAMAYLNHGTTSARTPDWVNWFTTQKPNNCEIWVMQNKRAQVLFPGFAEDGSLAPMPNRFCNEALFADSSAIKSISNLPSNTSARSQVEKITCSA